MDKAREEIAVVDARHCNQSASVIAGRKQQIDTHNAQVDQNTSARHNKKRPLAQRAKWPFLINLLVGIAGFEPTTSASRRQRSTKLSYIPKVVNGARQRGVSYTSRRFLSSLSASVVRIYASLSTARRASCAMLSRYGLGESTSNCASALPAISSARLRVYSSAPVA